ncbi:S8 family peptidase [Geminicoccus roseus]|uniref:S8 family peptidase n=1 Tax=Geminicoccus roseus TaxID=404900 RepID=UPI000412E866|nr:S8 family serine peptidase [Geminicoccus roseus]
MRAETASATQPPQPGHTGRYLVLLPEDDIKTGLSALKSVAGLRVAHSSDYRDGSSVGAFAEADGLVLDALQVAVVATPPGDLHLLNSVAAGSGVLAIEPERVVHAFPDSKVGIPSPVPSLPNASTGAGWSTEYLRGYRDGVNSVLDRLIGDDRPAATLPRTESESEATWGLQAVRATTTRWTGDGIRVAVLDTGMDLTHPDFEGRAIEARSFVTGEEVQDGNGHGTHCIGTACGPLLPHRLPRYGVAGNALIHAGKVLSDRGSGSDGGILAGIDWAVAAGCPIVSMSLGAAVEVGTPFSVIFEQVGRRALRAGTLIVAAAGNDSRRPDQLCPVGHPANCPSIMAVAALDPQLRVAWFSCAGLNPQGGQVDIAAPGVAVYSAWPGTLYNTINGTSMATPHVAGIAALIAESDPDARGSALWARLVQSAHRLDRLGRDVGAGLVQAPF